MPTARDVLNRLKWGADVDVFMERCVKEAIHELGHTFGLRHCDDPGCVMHFSVSLADTDDKSRTFCKGCNECCVQCARNGKCALSIVAKKPWN